MRGGSTEVNMDVDASDVSIRIQIANPDTVARIRITLSGHKEPRAAPNRCVQGYHSTSDSRGRGAVANSMRRSSRATSSFFAGNAVKA